MVRFGYLHLASLGAESQLSAEASECAAKQYAFWPYHERVFEAYGERGRLDAATLTDVAGGLSLDTASFTSCLEAGTFRDEVQRATDFAQSLGVVATPTFLINGRVIAGAQPFEAFQRIIEAELAASAKP